MARKSRDHDDYEAHDAMHTLMRAEEIRKNPDLMKRAQKKAKEHSEKMAEVAAQADRLAKGGHISEKQMAKLKKTNKLASGREGAGSPSQTMRGVVTN